MRCVDPRGNSAWWQMKAHSTADQSQIFGFGLAEGGESDGDICLLERNVLDKHSRAAGLAENRHRCS